MPYQYGMQNAPSVGNGLPQRRPPVTATQAPGLPRRLGGNALQALFNYTLSDLSLQQEYAFVVPIGVAFVDAVCIGGGGGGGGGDLFSTGGGGTGGSLRWITRMPVTPGETLRVLVGRGGGGGILGASPISAEVGNASGILRGNVTLLSANGGGQSTSGSTAFGTSPRGGFVGGGNGGAGGSGGGGGAGGYTGSGGTGGNRTGSPAPAPNGSLGLGGGGGGGSMLEINRNGFGGGGTGIYQIGSDGIAGVHQPNTSGTNIGGGGGGSGGQKGFNYPGNSFPVFNANGYSGGIYGGAGGGAGNGDSSGTVGGSGVSGAVRIIWGGGSRSYPYNSKLDIFR